MGACCYPDGSCLYVVEADCQTGDWRIDVLCDPNPCPPPPPEEAVCCFSDGSCEVLTEDDCFVAGGTWRPDLGDICDPNPCPQELQGCSHGFWKNDEDAWMMTGYAPGNLVGNVFTVPSELSTLADDTLEDALRYHGGNAILGGARILLRHAVASLLNAAHLEINYAVSEAMVISMVNEALAGLDRRAMLQLKGTLDDYNNMYCPLEDDDDGWSVEQDREEVSSVDAVQVNVPNPIRPNSLISMELRTGGQALIVIYNVHGQRIRTLLNRDLSSGHHEVAWDGKTDTGQIAGPGIYYVTATIGRTQIDRKVVLVR
jgi:hypothetical protein